MNKARTIRVRWRADAPPLPLGCRWCGHAPYAHEAYSLPRRRDHLWEQPTPRQVQSRMTARRRLGMCGPLPATASRPSKVQPPVVSAHVRPGRHARPVPIPVTHDRGHSQDTFLPRQHDRRPWRERIPTR